MGANHDNIGKSIGENLKGLRDAPDEELWGRISETLDKKKKKRLAPIWWLFGGIGIGTLLLFLGTYFNDQPGIDQKQNLILKETLDSSIENGNVNHILKSVTHTSENSLMDTLSNSSVVDNKVNSKNPNNLRTSKSLVISNTQKATESVINSSYAHDNEKITAEFKHKGALDENHPTTNPNFSKESKVSFIDESGTNNKIIDTGKETRDLSSRDSLLNLRNLRKEQRKKSIAENKKVQDLKDSLSSKSNDSPWSVTLMGIGSFYQNLNNGSALGEIYNDLDVTNKASINYGMSLNFNANDYIQLRIGVNHLRFNQTTVNIPANASELSSLRTILYGSVTEQEINNFLTNSNQEEVDIDQKLNYVEIPFEFRVRLNDDKLQFSTILGWSYMMNLDNSFILRSNDGELVLGKHSLLNDSNFNINAGFGLRSPIAKRLYINADLMFKYQLRAYSQLPDNYPAFFNLQTGIEYKF